jgi:hypothetical protein
MRWRRGTGCFLGENRGLGPTTCTLTDNLLHIILVLYGIPPPPLMTQHENSYQIMPVLEFVLQVYGHLVFLQSWD